MKRYLAALAVLFAALLASSGCSENNTSVQGNTGALLSSLSPSNALAGSGSFTITALGSGFDNTTVVQWNGADLTSTFIDTNHMSAVVPAADIAQSGKATIQTLSAQSGSGYNGLSNPIAFIILASGNPAPAITIISPTSDPGCTSPCTGYAVTLTVTGSNFLLTTDPSGGSLVHWNMGPTQTSAAITAITATQITATLTGTQLSTPGCASVTVFNPGPGSTSSNSANFSVAGGACPAASSGVVHEAPAVSSDGRYVAYAADANGHTQIYVRDTCAGADSNCQPRTDLASVEQNATPGNADSHSPSLSADGRYVAFSSAATNLIADAPAGRQVYLRDTCVGAAGSCKPSTQLVSTDASGALVGTENTLPSLSTSGRFVAFLSVTPSHTAGANASANVRTPAATGVNSGIRQVFVRDTCLGAAAACTPKTTRISQQPGDAPVDGGAPTGPAISGNSNKVAIAGNDVTLLTHGVALDDHFFLALTSAAP